MVDCRQRTEIRLFYIFLLRKDVQTKYGVQKDKKIYSCINSIEIVSFMRYLKLKQLRYRIIL